MDKVFVRDAQNQYEETLAAIDRSGFTKEWAKNQTDQLTLVAENDNSLAYSLLQVENSLIFRGQEYIIKQCEQKYNGSNEEKDITATAVRYECSRIFKSDSKSGTLTYTIQDVLHYFFDGNKYGFDWEIQGNFPSAQIENLGNGSGKDCIDKCVDAFNAVVMANNRHLIFYTVEAFRKETEKVYRYGANTTEFTAKTDSTSIQNIAMCFGKQKDSSSDNNTVEYYFAPFEVRDEDSINRWGERWGASVSDNRFTDADAMRSFALKSMQTQPLTELTITYDGDDSVQQGEVWLLEVQSQNFITEVTVDGIKEYPLNPAKPPEVTLDNSYKTLYDYDRQLQKNVSLALTNIDNFNSNFQNELGNLPQFGEKVGEVND